MVGIGALLVLGTAAQDFATRKNLMLESTSAAPNTLWPASTCPLCSSGAPLEDIAGFRVSRLREF